MKTPNDYPLIKFRPGTDSELLSALTARVEQQEDKALSRVARRDLNRYYLMLPLLLPAFSEDEALLLVQALNGTRMESERADRLWAEIEDEALSRKIKSLSFPACVAILDAIERFWLGSYSKSSDETRQKLRDVGLVKP